MSLLSEQQFCQCLEITSNLQFQYYKQAANDYFPHENFNLSRVLSLTEAEALIRVFCHRSENESPRKNLTWNGIPYSVNEYDKPGSVAVNTRIAEDIPIKGNVAGLHMLFYQIVKNAAAHITRMPTSDSQINTIEIAADIVRIGENPLTAVMISDDGPGFDLAELLRRKQQLAQNQTNCPAYLQTAWGGLSLSVHDVMQFSAERYISASERNLGRGIGLHMASEITNGHNGFMWITNRVDAGTTFLFLFDPTGKAHTDMPALFPTGRTHDIPFEVLAEIEASLRG